MTYGELYKYLSESFPCELSCSWDNDGDMLSFDESKEIKKVLTVLDITLEAIEYAKNNDFDLIISHHPLIFGGLKRVTPSGAVGKRLVSLINAGVAAMSFHTRLDAAALNMELCRELELSNIESYEFDGVMMGAMGDLKSPMTRRELALYIKEKLSAHTVVYADKPFGDKPILKLAVLGGGGGDAASSARLAGADALLTGDCSHHTMIDQAEEGMPIFAAGHYDTEKHICKYLKNKISIAAPDIYTEAFASDLTSEV